MADNLISRIYENFRGVDFRGEEINLSRSPDSLNVWKDYSETESIRTRPKMERAGKKFWNCSNDIPLFDDTIYGVFFFDYEYGEGSKRTVTLVHSGTNIYEVRRSAINENGVIKRYWQSNKVFENVARRKSYGFVCNGDFYFLDGKYYLKYTTDAVEKKPDGTMIMHPGPYMIEVEGYIPTTSIARKPSGGGTVHEDVNLLTLRRKNTFLADGTSTDFYVDSPSIRTQNEYGENLGKPVIVKVNGTTLSEDDYIVYYSDGFIKFKTAPPKPLTDGQDNVEIEFSAGSVMDIRKIRECRILEVFDNRVFFSGNPYHPNTVWHCSLNDPTYVSDLDYYTEGLDRTNIKSMVSGNNALWVFKEPSTANTSVFYHTPTIDSEYGKIYPSEHSSIAIGCVGGAINFNDDIIFFSQTGMEGMHGDITTEQAVAHRSSLVDSKLLSEANYKDMILVEWKGYLLVIMGKKAFVADSRAKFTNNDHYEYEWFYWEFDKTITCATVYDGELYLGAEGGIYTLSDNEGAVESYWVTPKDKFKYPQYQKTTNKRGCVVEATGDISISVKTDKTDFELIGNYTNIIDYFVSRIKRKKFKDIQLKFHSNTRFSLETATLECFIGGYIKR